ncbi:hypothetical protein SGCOL_008689 [Colletotrichum sp. CLE4]
MADCGAGAIAAASTFAPPIMIHFPTNSGSRGQGLFASLERLQSHSSRSMESTKEKQAKPVPRVMSSQGVRTSRASTESRGPFSSKEDLDIDVDDVEDLELPPNILADDWDSSAQPSSGSEPQHPRRRASKKPKKRAARKEQKKRGFRARLRRFLGRDGDKGRGGHESPYSHRQTTQTMQSEESGLSDLQNAMAEQDSQPAKADLSSPKGSTPQSSCRNILRDALAQHRVEEKEEPTDKPKEAGQSTENGDTTKQ